MPKSITATTQYCAVYGHPIKHSASPAMQNPAIEALGLNWRYLAFDVDPAQLRAAIQGAGAMRFIGLNLTVPHKVLAMEMVDILDESARKWGAVNTILFEGKTEEGDWVPLINCSTAKLQEVRTRGFNTDADAIEQALESDLGLKIGGSTVLLLGAGGAARAAALKLAEIPVKKLCLVNRTASKARELAEEISKKGVKCEIGYPKEKIDLILNGTSLGLKEEDPLPFDAAGFSLENARFAYDMIYRPVETEFLRQAKRAGCKIANGAGMLLYQGAKALEIWSGKSAPVEVMRRALHDHLQGDER